MVKEIKLRKKRVFIWMLVAVLLWNQMPVTMLQDADYNNIQGDENVIEEGDFVSPGDTISCQMLNDASVDPITV